MYTSRTGEKEDLTESKGREGGEKRGEGHTFAKDNFFPLRSEARFDLTNSNNPPVEPFPVESNETEADPNSGTKA